MRRALRIMLGIALGLLVVAILLIGGWTAYIRSVETPRYALVLADEPFELRDYPALVMAQVVRTGARRQAASRGFGPLASYIFAKGREGEKIAMTAPVTQVPGEPASGAWTIGFIMPAQRTLASLPRPVGSDVRLVEVPPRRMAAVRFSGWGDDATFGEQQASLEAWVRRRGLETVGAPVIAYYDDPLVPGPLRRNEVLLEVIEPGTPRPGRSGA